MWAFLKNADATDLQNVIFQPLGAIVMWAVDVPLYITLLGMPFAVWCAYDLIKDYRQRTPAQ